jgi:hypothetical protein
VTFATAAKAKAAVKREIDRRVQDDWIAIDPRRLRSNVPGARRVSRATLSRLLAHRERGTDASPRPATCSTRALLYDGTLRADRLRIGPAPLVVAGDLIAKRLVDGHRADETALVVLGDLDVGDCATLDDRRQARPRVTQFAGILRIDSSRAGPGSAPADSTFASVSASRSWTS